MATQRYISTSFWDDPWIQSIEYDAKYLYMYLLTNPLTNIAGVYKTTVRRISFDTGLDAETINDHLNLFAENKKAFLFGEYLILPNWPKHQKKNSEKVKKGIISCLQDLPENVLCKLHDMQYDFDLNLVNSTIFARKMRRNISAG